jgi:hypothetical protein
MTKELLPFCECGCGRRVSKIGNRFINGHNIRGDRNPMNNPKSRKKHQFHILMFRWLMQPKQLYQDMH